LYPSVPAVARSPLMIGRVEVPSRFFLAPMAGYTSLAFRLAVRSLGGLGLATTDLVNARSLIEGRRRALELSETCPKDHPIAIQLYGHVVSEMVEASQIVEALGATIIDINMGCPVRKVVRSGGGSALLNQVDRAVELAESIVSAVSVPVTVKMRLGWDDESLTAPLLAREFEGVGVAAVVIHGRTRQQGFSGTVNRAGIRAVVEAVRAIPIVANGDIRTIADAALTFHETGCAAISIGRGALANPFVFRQLSQWSRSGAPGGDPSFEERVELMRLHFAGLLARRGEHYACLQFRKCLRWYYQFTRMPKSLYLKLINLSSARLFEEVVASIIEVGPCAPLPGHLESNVAVPSGPVALW
jgi:tRNA-dihydrouridine synthase B